MTRYSAFWSGPGGAVGNRTPDLVIANDALYQLSYSPNLNLAPIRVHPERGFAHRRRQVKRSISGAFAFITADR
jgi:hypothetical protein